MTNAAHLTLSDSEQFKHTPEPWTFMSTDTWAKCKGPRQLSSIAHVGEYVVTTLEQTYEFHANDEDDANFICHAVNCHADLLSALKTARECIAYCRKAHKDAQSGEGFPVEMVLDAVIAKAEGRAP